MIAPAMYLANVFGLTVLALTFVMSGCSATNTPPSDATRETQPADEAIACEKVSSVPGLASDLTRVSALIANNNPPLTLDTSTVPLKDANLKAHFALAEKSVNGPIAAYSSGERVIPIMADDGIHVSGYTLSVQTSPTQLDDYLYNSKGELQSYTSTLAFAPCTLKELLTYQQTGDGPGEVAGGCDYEARYYKAPQFTLESRNIQGVSGEGFFRFDAKGQFLRYEGEGICYVL